MAYVMKRSEMPKTSLKKRLRRTSSRPYEPRKKLNALLKTRREAPFWRARRAQKRIARHHGEDIDRRRAWLRHINLIEDQLVPGMRQKFTSAYFKALRRAHRAR